MEKISRPGTAELALLGLTALIWGTAFAAIKISVVDLGAVWTAAGRVFIGFVVLLPVCMFTGFDIPTDRKTWFLICMVAILNMVVPFILISWSMHYIDSGLGALILGATPITAMLLGHFFTQDEKINRYRFLAVMMGLCGIIIIVGPDAASGLGSATFLAQISIIASGACYVCAGLIMRRLDVRPIPFTATALGTGAFILILIALVTEGLPAIPERSASLALLWLGVFPTGLAYVLRFFLVRRVGISTFSLGMNSVPVFGIMIGAFWLNEKIEGQVIFALGLIVCALFVSRLGMPADDKVALKKKDIQE